MNKTFARRIAINVIIAVMIAASAFAATVGEWGLTADSNKQDVFMDASHIQQHPHSVPVEVLEYVPTETCHALCV